MKRVITYGTFDLIHYGHINLLERAKKMGDYLIVGLSTNQFNEEKNKKCYFSFFLNNFRSSSCSSEMTSKVLLVGLTLLTFI